MRSLFELAGYEYKKMFLRKGTIIALALGLLITCFVQIMFLLPLFTADETPWQNMAYAREHSRSISGTPIDGDLISRAWVYSETIDGSRYDNVRWITQSIISMSEAQSVAEANTFYELHHSLVQSSTNWLLDINRISERGAEWIMTQHESIDTPWVYEYFGGYYNFFTRLSIVVVVLFFALAVSIAPVFATEHSTGVAQIMLASKFGKSKLIWAKLLTAATFSAGITFVFLLCSYGINMAVFGADGGAAAFQLFWPPSPYNFNMAQVSVIYILNAASRAIFFGAAVLLLSAKLKSSFSTIIFASVWVFLASALVVALPIRWLFDLYRLIVEMLPVMVIPAMSTFSIAPYEIFGFMFPPFVFEAVFSLVVGAAMLIFAGRVFKRYQVG
ncbi:MAG: hypothetical protein FWB88_12935 [Defluviitaleaceae bacterium]|nr:hypothetical protein [Defluviitaleaceae bacterium]MCL2240511.1 hypothetical protein [Defluviitaleaceae bacterium]